MSSSISELCFLRSLYGLFPRGTAFEVFTLPVFRRACGSPSLPLLTFRSPSEFHASAPSGFGSGTLALTASLTVFSPSTFSQHREGGTSRGFTLCSPLPSQRFARSQGLAPPGTCRPCFMPVPSLGFFPFRAYLRPRSSTSSRTPMPSCGFGSGFPLSLAAIP